MQNDHSEPWLSVPKYIHIIANVKYEMESTIRWIFKLKILTHTNYHKVVINLTLAKPTKYATKLTRNMFMRIKLKPTQISTGCWTCWIQNNYCVLCCVFFSQLQQTMHSIIHTHTHTYSFSCFTTAFSVDSFFFFVLYEIALLLLSKRIRIIIAIMDFVSVVWAIQNSGNCGATISLLMGNAVLNDGSQF